MVNVEELQRIEKKQGSTSSKGNQNKWYAEGKWYKEDGLGYEALAEVLISRLLKKTTADLIVEYEYEEIQRKGQKYHGCVSDDFMKADDDKIISIERLFQAYLGQSAVRAILSYPDTIEKIRYVVHTVEKITGIENFGSYMREVLTIDALFLNEDRHFHNMAVIRKKDGTFRKCPLFDNGASLFSDVKGDYPLDMPEEECLEKIKAKPFSIDFDEQLDACELAFPEFKIHMAFTIQDVKDVLKEFQGIYEDEVLQRIEEVLRVQMRKYEYLFI